MCWVHKNENGVDDSTKLWENKKRPNAELKRLPFILFLVEQLFQTKWVLFSANLLYKSDDRHTILFLATNLHPKQKLRGGKSKKKQKWKGHEIRNTFLFFFAKRTENQYSSRMCIYLTQKWNVHMFAPSHHHQPSHFAKCNNRSF